MHFRRSVVVIVALVSAALSSTLLTPAPAVAAYAPPGGAVFNNPQGSRDAAFRIIRTVNKAIKHSHPGSRIQMSMYMMDAGASTDLLVGARKRGVKVQLVLDGTARNPQTRRLARVLNRDNHKLVKVSKATYKKVKAKQAKQARKAKKAKQARQAKKAKQADKKKAGHKDGKKADKKKTRKKKADKADKKRAAKKDAKKKGAKKKGAKKKGAKKKGAKKRKPRVFKLPRRGGPDRSFVVFCRKSCRSIGKPNHTKYFTFTHTGSARNVVMVSSSNLNRGGALKGFNDLYVMKGRPGLMSDFARVHKSMAQDTTGDGRDRYLRFQRGAIVARFYPKRNGPDPVMLDLKKIRCKGVQGRAGRGGRTAINVSMFRWNSERGFKIARRLVTLDKQGCKVSVIFGAPGSKVWGILMRSARRGGIRLWDSRVDFNYDLVPDLRTHHKYLLINGRYGRDRSSWQVHTGSANWGRSLRAGDENTLSITGRGAYQEYIRNWRWVSKHGARRVGVR